LFGCAIAVSLRSGNSIRYLDESDYAQLAISLIHSHSFTSPDGSPAVYRPPGYPAVIAAAYLIGEHPVVAKLENVFILTLAALTLCIVANRIYPTAGAITPFLVLAYPLLIYATSLLYPQILACLILTLAVLLVSGESFSAGRATVAGVSYGFLILAVPYFIFLIPIIVGYVLFRRDLPQTDRIRGPILLIGAAALIVIPWTTRNYLEFHQLIPVSVNGGSNLFVGNSPDATPNGSVKSVRELCNHLHPGMNIIEVDHALGKCAVEWITANPKAAGKLYVGKLVNYFNFTNELATKSASIPWTDWLLFITYYPLLLIAVARAALFRRFPFDKTEILIYLIYFVNAFISAIFFTRIRFRIPFDFLLIAIAAGFLARCWGVRRSGDYH
jgi:hypothetical protein